VPLPDFSTPDTGSDGAASSAGIDSLTTSRVEANQLATAALEPNGEPPGPSRKPMLSERASFWAAAAVLILAFVANAAASPLYRVYQAQFRFSATTLTLLFAVYVFALLATLLVLGSLSDYLGRRPVVLAGLVAGAAGCGLFLIAHDVGVLYAARALQGVSAGLITGAASAALLDLRPNGGFAPLVSSMGPTGGQALGAIGAGALAQYAVAPTRLVWWLLLGGFILGLLPVLAMPEPGTTRRGALSSLRPHVSVPRQARGAFAAAVPALVGIWAFVGFYNSLGPSLAALPLHSENLLWGGLSVCRHRRDAIDRAWLRRWVVHRAAAHGWTEFRARTPRRRHGQPARPTCVEQQRTGNDTGPAHRTPTDPTLMPDNPTTSWSTPAARTPGLAEVIVLKKEPARG